MGKLKCPEHFPASFQVGSGEQEAKSLSMQALLFCSRSGNLVGACCVCIPGSGFGSISTGQVPVGAGEAPFLEILICLGSQSCSELQLGVKMSTLDSTIVIL